MKKIFVKQSACQTRRAIFVAPLECERANKITCVNLQEEQLL